MIGGPPEARPVPEPKERLPKERLPKEILPKEVRDLEEELQRAEQENNEVAVPPISESPQQGEKKAGPSIVPMRPRPETELKMPHGDPTRPPSGPRSGGSQLSHGRAKPDIRPRIVPKKDLPPTENETVTAIDKELLESTESGQKEEAGSKKPIDRSDQPKEEQAPNQEASPSQSSDKEKAASKYPPVPPYYSPPGFPPGHFVPPMMPGQFPPLQQGPAPSGQPTQLPPQQPGPGVYFPYPPPQGTQYPFPYPFQLGKPPFSKNPEWIWKLLIIAGILGIIISMILFISISSFLAGEIDDIELKGVITDTNGDPIIGANITIIDMGLNTTTGQKGNYSITNVESGTHTFLIEADGYYSIYYNLTIFAENPFSSDSYEKDFELTEKANGSIPPKNIDESIEDSLYIFPTIMVIASTIAFLGGLSARKLQRWSLVLAAATIGILSFGCFISTFLCVAAIVILIRTRPAFDIKR